MTNLRVRTEYSFRTAFGHLPRVLAALDAPHAAITDRAGTWGHVEWAKLCKKAGKKPVFGVELAVVADLAIKDPKQRRATYFTFLARNNSGLREIYELVTEATSAENFYFHPRIDYGRAARVTKNVIIIVGSNPQWDWIGSARGNGARFHIGLSPSSLPDTVPMALEWGLPVVALSDNYFPRTEDRAAYEVVVGRNRDNRTTAMHILDRDEWLSIYPKLPRRIDLANRLAAECDATLPSALMVKFISDKSLESMCREYAPSRGVDLSKSIYANRLRREIDLIQEKDFDDYFYVIADVLKWAKSRMLVGPARGSSCGSLVCYLLSITEIDPIPYDLLFERFIDVNRKDLPDIDIDFPDVSRNMVFDYLKSKYGSENVARLGTIITYKAKNTIADVATALQIPKWEVEELKGAMIERSGGDSRASFCILDTFNELDIGKATLAKYPELAIAAEIEGHARQAGQHAAGIVITALPVSTFCSIDKYMDRAGGIGVTHLDKKDAEALNLLKIDALGLRTLSVIQDTLDQIGWTRERLIGYPTDDQAAFDILNNKRFSGIFQFDGLALQSLTREMRVEQFEDIAAMTALARPGPLDSGGAQEWIKRRIGRHEVRYIHEAMEPMTRVTYGIVVYQEQVMRVVREVGGMTWEETSSIRKAMSGRLGKEFFDAFWVKFRDGAVKNGVAETDAKAIWEQINTMGSWAFNRCLAADTKIRMAVCGSNLSREVSIQELYERYTANPSAWIKSNKLGGPLVISLHPDGRGRPQRTLKIHRNGRKPLIKLHFSDGSLVSCTKEHIFMINGDWSQAGTSQIGDEFSALRYEVSKFNFKGKGKGHNKGKKYITPQAGFPGGVPNIFYDNGRTPEAKRFAKKMVGKPCQKCGTKDGRKETNHNDNRSGELRPSDLSWVCVGCHKKIHYGLGRNKVWDKGHAQYSKVLTSISNGGYGMTYDLEMPEHHNFALGNGIITHNSHAVAYGLVSYWTLVLKAHFPLEYSAAVLRNARSRDQAVLILRDLAKEGFSFKLFDPIKSQVNWSVQDGTLTGGLLNVKGIGAKKAVDILERRRLGKALPPGLAKTMANPVLDIDGIFPTREIWGRLLDHPEQFPRLLKEGSHIDLIESIASDTPGEFRILGRVVKKSLRDHNELTKIQKRDGRVMTGQTKYLILTVEDDSGTMLTMVNRHDYLSMGAPIIESGAIGDWYMIRGRINEGMRILNILQTKKLDPAIMAP